MMQRHVYQTKIRIVDEQKRRVITSDRSGVALNSPLSTSLLTILA